MKRILFVCLALSSCGLYAQEDDVVVGLKAIVSGGRAAVTTNLSCNALSNPIRAVTTSDPVATTTRTTMTTNGRMVPGASYVVTITAQNQFGGPTPVSGASGASLDLSVPQGFVARIDGIERHSIFYSLNPTQTSVQNIYAVVQVVPVINESGLRAGVATSLSTDKVLWTLSLGDLINGRPAGHLTFNNLGGTQTLAAMFSATSIMCDSNSSAVTIVYQRDASNAIVLGPSRLPIIRQIIAPQVVVDVVAASSTSVEVKCYHPSFRAATPAANGTYTFNGDPFNKYIFTFGATDTAGITLVVESRNVTPAAPTGNAPANNMVSRLTRTGTAPAYNWASTGWVTSGQQALIKQTRNITATGETITVTDGADVVAFKKTRTFVGGTDFVLAAGIGSEQVGTTNPIKSSYTYFSDATQPNYGLLDTLTNDSSGATTSFTYGTGGTLTSSTVPFKSTNAKAVTSTAYTQDEYGTLKRPLSISGKVNGVDVSKSSFEYDDGFTSGVYTAPTPITGHVRLKVFTATQTDSTSSSASLVTRSRQFSGNVGYLSGSLLTDDFFAGLPYSVKTPDGLQQSYACQRGTWNGTAFAKAGTAGVDVGPASRIAVISGTAAAGSSGVAFNTYDGFPIDPIYLVPGRSTMSVTIRDQYARIVRVEGHVYSGTTWSLLSWTNLGYNYANELTSRSSSTNTSYSAVFSGGRMSSETDESGMASSYTYDKAGRVLTMTRYGVTTTYDYDGMSRVTKETITGGDESMVTSRAFDDAGRLTSETFPGRGTTTHAYDPAALTHTTTLPNAAQIVEKSHFDGTPLSVTGSATVAKYYDYGVETDGRRFSTVSLGSSTSSRWSKAWVDWLGRDIQTVSPDPSVANQSAVAGSGVIVTSAKGYDAKGRLSSVSITGKASTYFEYDDLSELVRTGLDVDGTATLTLASSDRITDSNQYFEQIDGVWWRTAATKTYPTLGSATAITASTVRSRLSGFTGGVIAEIKQTDIDGNLSTQVTNLNASTATVTVTSTAPGMANSAVRTTTSGLVKSLKGFDGLTTSYTYDGLLRLKTVTDPRQNTATYAYGTGTTLISSITDAANNQTSYGYDAMGRQEWVADALNQRTYYGYNSRSQILHQWGSGTYPVAYTYNTLGERTGLTTYRSKNLTTWSGATWPTSLPVAGDTTQWAYDSATGLLTSKTDAASKSVTFTYNRLGQTATTTTARGIVNTYSYHAATSELTSVSYANYVDPDTTRGTISTPGVSYTYSRLGQVLTVTDAAGLRQFNYAAAAPWRLSNLVLPSFFGSRTMTPIYESATNSTTGTVQGRQVGFDLAGSSLDLHQQFTVSNLGRISGLNTRTTTNAALNYAFNYKSDGLIDGYSTGNLAVSQAFEAKRNLPTQLKATWGGVSVTQFDYTYNVIGQRLSSQQSGSAYSDYGSAVHRRFLYNSRGEVQSTAMYNGAAPASGASSSASEIPGRRFEFRYDDIGNRSTSGETGTVASGDESYTTNSLNQYTAKDNNLVRIWGTAASGAKVSAFSSDGQMVPLNINQSGFGGDLVPKAVSGPAMGTINIYGALTASGSTTVTSTSRSWFFSGLLQTFKYDPDGNLISDGIYNYFYDAESRLVKMATLPAAAAAGYPNQTLQFTYDYMGRRIEKKVTALPSGVIKTTRFLYGGWNLVGEIDGTSLATLRTFTWGGGALLQIQDVIGGKGLLPITDGNSNITALINPATGGTEAVYEYGPFGELVRSQGVYAKANPFRFSSYYHDEETDLVYYGFRYYSSALGRFINRDPIAEAGGVNLYGFCGNDGINRTDYLGLSWLSELHHWGTRHLSTVLGPGSRPVKRADRWINRQWNTNPYFRLGVGLVASYFTGGLAYQWAANAGASTAGSFAAAGFASGVTTSTLNGGNVQQTLRAGVIGAAIGYGVGSLYGDGASLRLPARGGTADVGGGIGSLSTVEIGATRLASSSAVGFTSSSIGAIVPFVTYGWTYDRMDLYGPPVQMERMRISGRDGLLPGEEGTFQAYDEGGVLRGVTAPTAMSDQTLELFNFAVTVRAAATTVSTATSFLSRVAAERGMVTLYHGTSTEAAAAIRAGGIDLAKSRSLLDFGKGFYTTTDLAQAQAWAARINGEVLTFRGSALALRDLRGLTFSGADSAWESFVLANRTGASLHSFDFVSGPMLGNPGAFLRGGAARAFGQQTSFHSEAAVSLLDSLLVR